MSVSHLKNNVFYILDKYCKSRIYVIFKPIFYSLAYRYITKLSSTNKDVNDFEILKIIFNLYKYLVLRQSERLATSIGCELATYFNLNLDAYLNYRDAKMWTQRYIHGLGLFESVIYSKNENTIHTQVDIDPIFVAFNKLKNQVELSKVLIDAPPCAAKNSSCYP